MTNKNKFKTKWLFSEEEKTRRENFFELLKKCPIPPNEFLQNLGLFLNGPALTRILFMDELYKKIVNVHGVVMEFGVRWGQNLALFSEFRALYEPYNYNRKIIGFDTFEGFPSVHKKDGEQEFGGYAVIPGYEKYLEQILDYHNSENPIPHIKKYELIKGDAIVEAERYLEKNPQTIVALAYFDFDIYEPTKVCLELIKNYIAKGSVIGFDELNREDFPGETIALNEVLGLRNIKIRRSIYSRVNSYIIVE